MFTERTALVLLTSAVAVAVPDFSTFTDLVGNFFMPIIGFLVPPAFHLVLLHRDYCSGGREGRQQEGVLLQAADGDNVNGGASLKASAAALKRKAEGDFDCDHHRAHDDNHNHHGKASAGCGAVAGGSSAHYAAQRITGGRLAAVAAWDVFVVVLGSVALCLGMHSTVSKMISGSGGS